MNKPVAWMDENENVIFEKNWAYPIPLYTHPAELTDEEIKQVWSSWWETDCQEWAIEFARAILKRSKSNDEKN